MTVFRSERAIIKASPEVVEYLKERSLNWFNNRRYDLGYSNLCELPKAEPMSSYNCLICQSLKRDPDTFVPREQGTVMNQIMNGHTGKEVVIEDVNETVTLIEQRTYYTIPDYVFALACMFDNRLLEDLIYRDVTHDLAWATEEVERAQQICNTIQQELDEEIEHAVEKITVTKTELVSA